MQEILAQIRGSVGCAHCAFDLQGFDRSPGQLARVRIGTAVEFVIRVTRREIGCQFFKSRNIGQQRNFNLGEPLLRGFLAGRAQVLEEIYQQAFTSDFIGYRFDFVVAIFVPERRCNATCGHLEQVSCNEYAVRSLAVIGNKTSIVKQVIAFFLCRKVIVGKVFIQRGCKHVDRHTTVAAVAASDRARNRIHYRCIDRVTQ